MTKTKKPRKSTTKAKKSNKKNYKVRNWKEYNEALKQRGALDVWVDEEVLESWNAEPTFNPGRQPTYSDMAIQLTLQFGKVFGQKLRQTEGLVQSIFNLMGVNLKVPNYSTLSRRSCSIAVKLPKSNKEKVTLIVDSSGLKVFGEGEWKVRKHGYSKHRTWMKMHLAVTADGEIRLADLTDNATTDSKALLNMIDEEEATIEGLSGDGAYDKRKVYDKCQEKQIEKILIPPQRNAKIWQHGNSSDPPHPRDENLRNIRKTTRKLWKENVGYHVRSLSETAMFRFKSVFGDRLDARDYPRQRTEFLIKATILNKMMRLGMPESYVVN